MPLSTEEKEQALSLAKGMLLAQQDNLSLSGNLVNNPHFTNVPHTVKLEALRQYAKLEDEGVNKTTVNIEASKADIGKAVAKASLIDGAISLPVSALIGYAGTHPLAGTGHHPNELAKVMYKSGPKGMFSKHLGRLAPLVGTVFLANAAVGGVREAIKQKAALNEARMSNKYLDRIRSSSSDEDLNAMLLGANAKSKILQESVDRLDKSVEHSSKLVPGAITEESFKSPGESFAAHEYHKWGEGLDKAIDEHNESLSKTAQTSKVNMKTSKKSWTPKLRNTSSSPTFKAKTVKIRKEQTSNYNAVVAENNSSGKLDNYYRIGKAMAKRFLR